MSEGIEFLLELQANVEGAVKMVRELTKVEAATHKTDAALKNAEKQTSALGGVMHKGSEWLGEFGHEASSAFTGMFAATAVFEGLKEGVHLLFELGAEALHAAGEAERLRLTFRNMMGVELGDQTLDYLDQVAKHTEFTDGELKGFSSQLIRAGYSGDELKRALGGVIDMAAKSQDAMAGAASGVELLSRMNLKGGLSSRELVSAGISPAKLYKRLAGELGIGVKAVEEELQQGKIKAGVLREAFYAELVKPGAKLGDAGVAMSDTFEAKLKKVKDIIPNLFEELEKSDGLKGITAGLGHLVEALDPGSPAGKKIVAGLEKMLNAFGGFVETIDFDKFADRIVATMEVIEKVVEYGGIVIGALLTPISDILRSVGDWLGDLLSPITDAFRPIFDAVANAVTIIYDKAADIGAALWKGIKDGLTGGISAVIDTVTGLGSSIVDKMKGILGIHSPSKVFARLGMQTAAGFQLGIEAGTPEVNASMEQSFGAPAAADVGPGLGSGGGARSINIEKIEVNLGPVGDRSARDVAAEVAVSLREQMISLLEQLVAEGAGA